MVQLCRAGMAWTRRLLLCALLPATLLGGCDAAVEEEEPYDWGEGKLALPCDQQQAYVGYACETEDGQEGTEQCLVSAGREHWTPCRTEPAACVPGDNTETECRVELCMYDGELLTREVDDWCDEEPSASDVTPLVLQFDAGPVEFSPMTATPFELSPAGTCMSTAWPTAPWLALDRDGDGMIRSGAELFGSATAMRSGGFAQHGFAALAELDSNVDGRIDAADERFAELVLWNDLDDDRIGAYAELRPLADHGVISVELDFTRRLACDAIGNCGDERASFTYRRGDETRRGEVVDVHLVCQ